MYVRSLIRVGYAGVVVAALLAGGAGAEPAPASSAHAHKHQSRAGAAGGAVSTRAYKAAMQAMHRAMEVPPSGNADVDFVRQMIPHHEGAVAMAKIQLQHGTDERLKAFNRWVIFAQDLEIRFMKSWLVRRDNGAKARSAADYFGAVMTRMHHAMMRPHSGDADLDYVHGMIAHHQGAVDMVGVLMHEGTDPELKRLASDIYNAQTQEIAWMQRWLEQRPGK